MTWLWEWQWLLNLVTLAVMCLVALAKDHVLVTRNRGRRRDRLVVGLVGWNLFLFVGFGWGALAQLGLLPPPTGTLTLSILRCFGIAAGLVTLVALRTAPPLWEPVAMQDLRRRVLELEDEVRSRPVG